MLDSDLKVRAAPERTCLGCGAKKPQRQLVRVASQNGGAPTLDVEYSVPGRGAYVCCDATCIERAFKKRAFHRVLRLKAAMSPDLAAQIHQYSKEIQKRDSFCRRI